MRADFRPAARYGGHNALLVEGMMRDDIALGLKGSGKNVQIVQGPGDRLLKPQRQMLTLTTQEAIECGLAVGSAKRIADCRGLRRIEQWYDLTDHGRQRVAAWAKEIGEAWKKLKSAAQHVEAAGAEAQAYGKAARRKEATDALRRAESNLR